MDKTDYIFGIRAVNEALDAGKTIDRILIKKDLRSEVVSELYDKVKGTNILIQRVPEEKINRITRKNHQGVIAFVSPVEYVELEKLIPVLYEDGILPMVLVLDGITDVRNFGGIARTAECCGVNAIVIGRHGSVNVTPDAVKTSAGALLTLPVCREKSLAGAVKFLKDNGYTIVAASEKADINYTMADFTKPVAIVLGAEGCGISPEVLRLCDEMVSIPMFGHIGSLNVGVAGAVMMYEAVRQRLSKNMEVI